VDLGIFGFDVAGGFEMTEGVHGVFYRQGAVEPPLSVTEGLGKLTFKRSLGREALEEICAKEMVGLHVLIRHDDGAARESVARRVHGRALFAFFGPGTGGFRLGLCVSCR
jgi:hypothetical protein